MLKLADLWSPSECQYLEFVKNLLKIIAIWNQKIARKNMRLSWQLSWWGKTRFSFWLWGRNVPRKINLGPGRTGPRGGGPCIVGSTLVDRADDLDRRQQRRCEIDSERQIEKRRDLRPQAIRNEGRCKFYHGGCQRDLPRIAGNQKWQAMETECCTIGSTQQRIDDRGHVDGDECDL